MGCLSPPFKTQRPRLLARCRRQRHRHRSSQLADSVKRRRAVAALTGAAAADEEKGPAAAAAAKGESQTAVTQDGGPARRSARLSTYGDEPASAACAKEVSKTCGAITKKTQIEA